MGNAIVTVCCRDRDVSAEFYESVLGAVVDPEQDFVLGRCWFQLGPITINLFHNAGNKATANYPDDAMTMLTVKVQDVAETCEKARESTGSVRLEEPHEALLVDPDGLLVQITEYLRD